MSQLFYAPQLPAELLLTKEESHHLLKVLRLKEGDQIRATDGKGFFYELKILGRKGQQTQIEILSTEEDSIAPSGIHLAVAPTKNIDRFEWMIEKCVELGAERITPILCQRSERKIVRHDRLERIAISAMKQSLHSRKPNVDELISFEDFLSKAELNPSKYMAHCAEGERMEMLPNQLQLPATLLIGPEGDFHPEEVELAASQGFKMISMGHYRLRTETAAVYGCSLLLNSVFNSL